ncbi:MAG: efflux RND transporter periplasmic adaptor subunit [Patescibacteria group bacterium]|jgi:RND family efflux transporter MFP subunit
MKKLTKRQWIIAGGVAIFIVGIGLYFLFRSPSEAVYTTDRVDRGTITQTVEASGTLDVMENLDLSFETSGLLGSVLVKEGDFVQKGDLLVSLKALDLEADYRRAEEALRIADAQLALQIAGVSDEALAVSYAQVGVANAALFSAQIDEQNTSLSTSATLEDAKIRLDEAESTYADTVARDNQSIAESQENLLLSMKNAMNDVRSALSACDQILGIENTMVNDEFDDVLSNMDSLALQNAVDSFSEAREARDEIEEQIFSLTSESGIDEMITLESKAMDLMGLVEDTLLYTRQVLDATTLETASFSMADLAAFKTSIDTTRGSFSATQSSFQTYRLAYESTILASETNENSASYGLLLAQQAVRSAELDASSRMASAGAAVALREADLASAQASYDQLRAEPRFVDLEPYYADVDRAAADVDASLARLQKAQIIAPMGGIVTDIAGDLGEQIMAGAKVVELQSADDQFMITIDIPEADIVKVSKGDLASITFDAFGSDIEVMGSVSTVSASAKQIEGVVYYEVTILIPDNSQLDLRSGLSTDVTITTDEKIDVLNIPQRAVLERTDGTKYVRILDGNDYQEVDVTVGIRADGGVIEILNGLSEGETFILSTTKK